MDAGNTIVYQGYSYRRQPRRSYYFPSSWAIARHGRASLHRDIFRDANGPIPAGYHVHHIDHDTENNDPSNLELVSASDHARLHLAARAVQMAAGRRAWEATDEAKAVKRAAIRKAIANTPKVEVPCAHCSVPFFGRVGSRDKFCSRKCQETARRSRNLRPCPVCGEHFGGQVAGPNVAQTCSYACGWELRRRNRVRADG